MESNLRLVVLFATVVNVALGQITLTEVKTTVFKNIPDCACSSKSLGWCDTTESYPTGSCDLINVVCKNFLTNQTDFTCSGSLQNKYIEYTCHYIDTKNMNCTVQNWSGEFKRPTTSDDRSDARVNLITIVDTIKYAILMITVKSLID